MQSSLRQWRQKHSFRLLRRTFGCDGEEVAEGTSDLYPLCHIVRGSRDISEYMVHVQNLYLWFSPQVELGDGLPAQVCNECIAHLNAAVTFKEKCHTADSVLRHLLNIAVSDAVLLYFTSICFMVRIYHRIFCYSKKHKAAKKNMMKRLWQLIHLSWAVMISKYGCIS